LKPEELGTGGGYGKHAAMPIEQIAERFEACRADPSMRSVSAILRITKEQLESRGSLGSYRQVALLFLVLTLASLPLGMVAPETFQKTLQELQIALAAVTILLGLGVATTWRATHIGLANEREIRRLALNALEGIVNDPHFGPKPLDWSQELILRKLLKKGGSTDEGVARLLS